MSCCELHASFEGDIGNLSRKAEAYYCRLSLRESGVLESFRGAKGDICFPHDA